MSMYNNMNNKFDTFNNIPLSRQRKSKNIISLSLYMSAILCSNEQHILIFFVIARRSLPKDFPRRCSCCSGAEIMICANHVTIAANMCTNFQTQWLEQISSSTNFGEKSTVVHVHYCTGCNKTQISQDIRHKQSIYYLPIIRQNG